MTAKLNKQALISVKGLTNKFGNHVVHDELDLQIFPSEILGIVGASGSGKTVLLKTILGLQKPTSGEIVFKGNDITKMSEQEILDLHDHWGVLFQGGALFSGLTVSENVQLPMLEHHDIPNMMATQLASLKLKMTGLKDEAFDKYPSELSGGMKKRAALARSMALDPDILFLDEPTAGLDPLAADSFDDLVLDLRERLDASIVIITHDLDTLVKTCDRIAVIVDKKIIVDSLDGLMKHDHPWIKEYFQGPRMRAASTLREAG